MKKFQLLLVAEETLSKSKARIVEEIVIGEYSTMEDLEEGIEEASEQLNLELEEVGEDED